MKENKIGIILTLFVIIVTIFLTFLPQFPKVDSSLWIVNWIVNFSFAIFGSALVTLIVCMINYFIVRRKTIDKLSQYYYKLPHSFRNFIEEKKLKDDALNELVDEIHNLKDCYEECFFETRGMFGIRKKEKLIEKCLKKLSYELLRLDSVSKTESSSVNKRDIKKVLDCISDVEDVFYKKNDLVVKQDTRSFYAYLFGDLE